MNRKKIIQTTLIACLVIYSLAGFIAVPLAIKSILPEKLGAALKRNVFLGDASFNPYTLKLTLEGFEIKKKTSGNDFVSFNRLSVNLQMSSLFKMGLVLKEVSLEQPFIGIDRISDTRFNFSDLIEDNMGEKEEAEAEEQPSEPFRFEVSNIQIIDGEIKIWDDVIKKAHNIKDISFNVPFISNFEKHIDTHAKPVFTVQLNDAKVTADISTKPFLDSLETILDIKLEGVRLPQYVDYAPEDIGFTITKGVLEAEAKIFFTKTGDNKMTSKTSGTIDLHGLEVVGADGNSMVKLNQFGIVFAQSQFLKKDIRVERIELSQPEIDIRRNSQGDINLLPSGQSPSSEKDTDKETETKPSGQKSPDTEEPLRLVVDNLKIDSGWVRFHDEYIGETVQEKPASPVQIAMGPIQLGVQHFSTDQDSKGRFDFKTALNSNGDIAASGEFGVSPLFLDTNVDLKNIVFTWIEPYLQGNARLALAGGRFSTSGDLALKQDETQGLSAAFKGEASVEEVKTVDKFYAQDFASMNGLYLKRIDISYNPMEIALGEILLTGWRNRFVLHEDGNSNISKVFAPKDNSNIDKTEDPKQAAPPEKDPVIPIKIDNLSLQDIHVAFSDQQVKPNFSSELTISEAKITGLTSKEFKQADVVVKGKIDDYAPLEVTGKINPLQDDLFVDIAFSLGGVELTAFTPYSGKYIGNAIEKGKLSVDLTCLIEKKEVKADDKILLDQLTLGKEVDSPDALNLPVDLAISLLKDRNGRINLDVPVAGRLDDPEFSVGGVVLQTLINIVEKAAVSPFSLIADVAGGGEELQFIEFDAGELKVNDAGSKKLDSIITLLYERPGLNLGITGYADPVKDGEELSNMALIKKLKAQKRLTMIEKGLPATPLEDITVSPDEYDRFLRLAYAADTSSEPDDDMTVPEMETRLKEGAVVTDADLRSLALNRAKEVKSYLLSNKSIEPERLFLTESSSLTPEQTKGYRSCRVELNLE